VSAVVKTMNINAASLARRTQLPRGAFARPVGRLYGQLPIPRLVRIAAILCGLILGWNARGSCVTIIPPTNLDRPDYDYSNVTCTSCHFIDGYDHTARAAGLQFNSTKNLWERTGHGWWDSAHAQSQYGWSSTAINYGWIQPPGPYGETDNTFCAFCHSPLQASATEPGMFSDGTVINPVVVPTFQAVTCNSCHPSNTLAAKILAMYPTAISGGQTATLIRGSDPTQVGSWIPILPGGETQFCLNCHEQNPHTPNAIFQVMFDAGVTCIDCHMAPYIVGVANNTTGTPVGLTERFHDWKVAENLPYSCGAQGSLNQFTCHAEFTAASARAFIPLMTAQHSEWWSLPPFSMSTETVSAHELNSTSDQLALWREIQAVYGQVKRKEARKEGGARLKTALATR